MEIDSIIIERTDGPLFCGLLFYEHEKTDLYLPWTIDIQDPDRIVLKLFPPDLADSVTVVKSHYETMAGAIVDRVMGSTH